MPKHLIEGAFRKVICEAWSLHRPDRDHRHLLDGPKNVGKGWRQVECGVRCGWGGPPGIDPWRPTVQYDNGQPRRPGGRGGYTGTSSHERSTDTEPYSDEQDASLQTETSINELDTSHELPEHSTPGDDFPLYFEPGRTSIRDGFQTVCLPGGCQERQEGIAHE